MSSSSGIVQIGSVWKQKYSSPRHVTPGRGTIAADQLLKFWTRPIRTSGLWTYTQLSGKNRSPSNMTATRMKSRYRSFPAASRTSRGGAGSSARATSDSGIEEMTASPV